MSAAKLPTVEEMMQKARADSSAAEAVGFVSVDLIGTAHAGLARILTVRQTYPPTGPDERRLRVTRWLLGTEEGGYSGGIIRSEWV